MAIAVFASGCFSQAENTDYAKTPDYKELLPGGLARLPENFYPANLTREKILSYYGQAARKTGHIGNDTWSGIILVTGDLEADNLVIEPGTIVLAEANMDDQEQGFERSLDPMNPHEFIGKDYSKSHVSIRVNGELTARGTPDNPIIITSNAPEPWIYDWDYFSFRKGDLEYAVIEYVSKIDTSSSGTILSHCIIRNVMSQGLMFGTWPEAGIYGDSVTPNITYNYIYNFGHMAIQSFFSSPYIAHNIFIQKNTNDPELYDFLSKGENGALDMHGGNGTIEHNFLSCGYSPSFEKIRPEHGCSGIGITTANYPIIRMNTIAGNNNGIELQGGNPEISRNNIHSNVENSLVVRSTYSEPGRNSETLDYGNFLDFRNNWWGTPDKNEAMRMMNINSGIGVNIEPISIEEFPDAGPDWYEFEWMYE